MVYLLFIECTLNVYNLNEAFLKVRFFFMHIFHNSNVVCCKIVFLTLTLNFGGFFSTNYRFILSLLTCHLNDSMVAMHLYYGDGWIGLQLDTCMFVSGSVYAVFLKVSWGKDETTTDSMKG